MEASTLSPHATSPIAATPLASGGRHAQRARQRHRTQTRAEEAVNAGSHGIAFVLALVALPVLVNSAWQRGTAADVVAASLFAATMVVLYGVSTLYHALPAGIAKARLHRLDHASIYLFIAGSYTPFLFGLLRGGWGWSLFGVLWGAAALGVTAKLLNRLQHPLWSTGLYVAMGWVVLVAVVPLVQRMPATGIAWLVAGGVSYTAGAVVYLFDSRWHYVHFAWHLFVMAGSACHYLAALWYAIPAP